MIGDVVMWAEIKWTKQGRGRREKTVIGGALRVAAQVDGVEPGGLVALSVIDCEVLSSTWEPLKPLRRGERIRRRRETLEKGQVHRRVGDAEEESARAIVASRHLGPEPVALPARTGGRAMAPARRRYGGARGKGPRARLRPR